MSRSNPNENGAPNPSTRWFDWNGENGTVSYYDKETKKTVDCGTDFAFILLDELGSVRGWHEASKSGIYSNEVRDTRQDVLIVKAFKGGPLAEGLYKDIKDRVNTLGGQFVANCYIAYWGNADALEIGSLRFKGAALGAWMEFRKQNRHALYSHGVHITGFTEGKKGRITFRMPTFAIENLSKAENDTATKLDKVLQDWLAGYLKKNKRDQVEQVAQHVTDEDIAGEYDDQNPPPITDADIHF